MKQGVFSLGRLPAAIERVPGADAVRRHAGTNGCSSCSGGFDVLAAEDMDVCAAANAHVPSMPSRSCGPYVRPRPAPRRAPGTPGCLRPRPGHNKATAKAGDQAPTAASAAHTTTMARVSQNSSFFMTDLPRSVAMSAADGDDRQGLDQLEGDDGEGVHSDNQRPRPTPAQSTPGAAPTPRGPACQSTTDASVLAGVRRDPASVRIHAVDGDRDGDGEDGGADANQGHQPPATPPVPSPP